METLRLGFFVIRLVLANIPFFLEYFWLKSPLKLTFIFALLLLFLQIILIILAGQTTNLWQQAVNKYRGDVAQYQYDQRQAQIIAWEAKLRVQPNHRDILLKIAELYCLQENQVVCQEYWQRAAAIDPNNSQVIEFKELYLEN